MTETIIRPGAAASGRVTPASFPFYTTGEDNLRITSYNSAAGVSLKINGRLIDNAGKANADSWDHTPNTDRSAKTTDITLSGSTLLNMTVFAGAGSPKIGQTFVIVQLIRGTGVAALVLGTILQGYVTSVQAIGWPGSPIQSSIEGGGITRFIQGTNPGPGVQILETVPAGARWELLTIGAQFATSATPATRRPRIGIISGGVHLIDNYHIGTMGASSSFGFAWAQGMALTVAFAAASAYSGLVQSMPMGSGDTFGIDAENFQPGDDWGAPAYYVREWLEAA